MTTEIHILAMTDSQLANNNNKHHSSNSNSNETIKNGARNNNNNHEEPKYLHKKFKKIAAVSLIEASIISDNSKNSLNFDKSTNLLPKDIAASVGEESIEFRKIGYVCSYCKLSCAKPSVLQKHIRAHTNERPYPCVPCGFSFKTKSNLFKHYRSRAHALKIENVDVTKIWNTLHLSEDSDISLSDSASNDADTLPQNFSSMSSSDLTSCTVVSSKLNDDINLCPQTSCFASNNIKNKYITKSNSNDSNSSSSSNRSNSSCSCPSSNSNISDNIDGINKSTKIYKPKFHTILQACKSVEPRTNYNLRDELVQNEIKDMTINNEAIHRYKNDPKTCKFVHRQQSFEAPAQFQLLPVSFNNSKVITRKRCHSESSSKLSLRDLDSFLMCSDAAYNSNSIKNQRKITTLNMNLTSNYKSLPKLELTIPTKSEECEKLKLEKSSKLEPQENDYEAFQSQSSPGPLLGNTPLVGLRNSQPEVKRLRYEKQQQHLSKYQQINTLQMFGGEVKILNKSGESKTMRIETMREANAGVIGNIDVAIATSIDNHESSAATASVVVRSGLHSGGTILHKISNSSINIDTKNGNNNIDDNNSYGSINNSGNMHDTKHNKVQNAHLGIKLARIIPKISQPNLVPNVSDSSYLKPSNILHAGRVIPYVPGMPGPQSLIIHQEPLDLVAAIVKSDSTMQNTSVKVTRHHNSNIDHPSSLNNSLVTFSPVCTSVSLYYNSSAVSKIAVNADNKFVRPSSLPLKAGTFTPKRHHGITPTANTQPLISPETPRSKKSYGQLYLNGHAYTYLGLKCSTRLFYCTLNRPQPMYVTQKNALSMYSNWKICQETSSDFELAFYDSRHRPVNYTLACTRQHDILTHSTQRPCTPCNTPDSSLESDNKDKNKRVKIFDGGFESYEDYTYVRGRGRGRYVCEECGIRCKKPSMLKKHIRTHTDVRPFTCKYCAFSFKTKGNLTKHMKSKSHYKKCIDLKIYPVPTAICNENIDKEALSRLELTGAITDETSSEEDESGADAEDSDESGSEEHEVAQSLLSLAQSNSHWLQGLLPKTRPNTYPYNLNTFGVSNRNKIIFTTNSLETSRPNAISCLSKGTEYFQKFQSRCLFTESVEASSIYPATSSESQVNMIHSFKIDESSTAPIDLTTKHLEINSKVLPKVISNITNPTLLHTIIQSMNCLPDLNQTNHEYKSRDAMQGLMLQAYLTETYMMNCKLKQQYHVQETRSQQKSELEFALKNLSVPQKLPIQYSNWPLEKQCSLIALNEKHVGNLNKHSINESNSLQKELVKPLEPKSSNEISKENLKSVINKAENQHQQPLACKVVVGKSGIRSVSPHNAVHSKFSPEILKPPNSNASTFISLSDNNRSVCGICDKVFSKPSQLRLHINIHYFERPFKCESCGTSFRTKGHLTKHERSTLHHNKVSMTSTFGAATASNPRPFKCDDCKSAFRIHGHLAKHLRSKMHIMKLECLHKLPFGTYAEIERSEMNLNDIDTTDCDTSLTSLRIMVQKLQDRDSSKLEQWEMKIVPNRATSDGDTSSDESDINHTNMISQHINTQQLTKKYHLVSGASSNCVDLLDNHADKTKNTSTFKCQLCSVTLQNMSELHVHCFVEHKIESYTTSETPISVSKKEKI